MEKKPKKRIGRPTKPPKPGQRIALGLRVTPEMKKTLERAAIASGRSLSQEAELRLEATFTRDLWMADLKAHTAKTEANLADLVAQMLAASRKNRDEG